MNLNPQPAVNSFEVTPFSPAFLHGLQLGMCISPPQIDQLIVYNLTTIFAQSLLHFITIFAAPHYKTTTPHHRFTGLHHYLCCTSLQIHYTSPQIHWTSPQSLLHLTTIFAAPHHRSTNLTTNFTATTNSNLANRNPTPALQNLI